MKFVFRKKYSLLMVLSLVLVFLLVPFSQSKAVGNPFDISGIAFDAIEQMILGLAWLVYTIIGRLLSALASLLGFLINVSTARYPDAVHASWAIIRDFVNMFFILGLIIIAGATIFNVKKYNYEKLLPSLLIIAILINFSFTIGAYVISVGNGLTTVMTNQITNVGDRLGSAFKPVFSAATKPPADLTSASGTYINIMMSISFAITFGLIALLALLASIIFVLARTVVLWVLLIISPIAFFCYIFPDLKGKWDEWWKHLISWSFFLPVYLFFLSFAFILLGESNKYQVANLQNSSGILDYIGGGFNSLIFYCVVIFFMVYGLKAAFDIGSMTAGGVGNLMVGKDGKGGIQGAIRKYSGYESTAAGVGQGLKERRKNISERGIFGIGGEQSSRLRQAGVAELFGDRGAKEKQLEKEVSDQNKNYARITDINQLRTLANSGSTVQRLAAREALKDRGMLGVNDIQETYRMYQKEGPVSAMKFAKGIDFGDLSSGERQQLFDTFQDPETRKKLLKVRADKGDFKSANGEQLAQLTKDYFQNEGDKKDFLDKAQKSNFRGSLEAQLRAGLTRDITNESISDILGVEVAAEIKRLKETAGFTQEQIKANGDRLKQYSQRAIEQAILESSRGDTNNLNKLIGDVAADKVKKMNLDKILELPKATLEYLLNDKTGTKGIIAGKITPGNIDSIAGKVDQVRMEALDDLLLGNENGLLPSGKPGLRKVHDDREKQKLDRQADAQARGFAPFVETMRNQTEVVRDLAETVRNLVAQNQQNPQKNNPQS